MLSLGVEFSGQHSEVRVSFTEDSISFSAAIYGSIRADFHVDEELERQACTGEGKEGQSILQCPVCPVCSQSGQGPGSG